MKKILDEWGWPFVAGVIGLCLAYAQSRLRLAYAQPIELSELQLAATITLASVLVAFSSNFLAILINNSTGAISTLENMPQVYIRLLSFMRLSLYSFILLIVCSLLGFWFRNESPYEYIFFALTGFSLGAFVQVVGFPINLALANVRRQSRESSKEKASTKLSPVAHIEEATRLSDNKHLDKNAYSSEADNLTKDQTSID